MRSFFLVLLSLWMYGCGDQKTEVTKGLKSSVIYGDNDIKEYYEVRRKSLRKYAQSVAIQVSKHRLDLESDDYYINEETLDDLNLCKNQDAFHTRLSTQPALGHCTAFLINNNTLLTASHCVNEDDSCKDNYWVFNFFISDMETQNGPFPYKDVFSCSEIIKMDENLDYALIRLDRTARGKRPLKLRKRGKVSNDAPLIVAGYPQGLPLKFSMNARVRDNQSESNFIVNSDTFEGNSGSPVINTKNGLVEGVLIKGENDFDLQEKASATCQVLKYCPEDKCIGEHILRTTSLNLEI